MFSADELLAPISADSPSGEDLAFSIELDAISLARKFDDPSLDQGEWVADLKEADWDFVAKRCAALLKDKSKDLRLAVWLAEAAAKQYQLRGLTEGLRVLAGLCDDYWDLGLYPEADDGDNEQRIGNLSWILGRCPALLREMPLTEGRGTGYSTIDFEMARKQASRAGDGQPVDGVKLADMESARNKNSMAFMTQFRADADDCMAALLQLEEVADARLGADSPGFSAARDAVQAMQRAMPAGAAAATPVAASDTAPTEDQGTAQPGAAAATAVPGPQALLAPAGALHNRAQALAQLRQVAEFFRLTEPYSPVSYFADKAADAGSQDLHTWLRAVVKDESSLAHIEELLGVKPAE